MNHPRIQLTQYFTHLTHACQEVFVRNEIAVEALPRRAGERDRGHRDYRRDFFQHRIGERLDSRQPFGSLDREETSGESILFIEPRRKREGLADDHSRSAVALPLAGNEAGGVPPHVAQYFHQLSAAWRSCAPLACVELTQ